MEMLDKAGIAATRRSAQQRTRAELAATRAVAIGDPGHSAQSKQSDRRTHSHAASKEPVFTR